MMLAGLSRLVGYPVTSYRIPNADDERLMDQRGISNVGTIFVLNAESGYPRFWICLGPGGVAPPAAPETAASGRVIRIGQPVQPEGVAAMDSQGNEVGTNPAASSPGFSREPNSPRVRVIERPAAGIHVPNDPASPDTNVLGTSTVRLVSNGPVRPDMLSNLLTMRFDQLQGLLRPGTSEWDVFVHNIVVSTSMCRSAGYTQQALSRPGLFARQDGVTCQTQSLIHYLNLVCTGNSPFSSPRSVANFVYDRTREHLQNQGLRGAGVTAGLLDVSSAISTIQREYGIVLYASTVEVRDLVSVQTDTARGSYLPQFGYMLADRPGAGIGHATLLVPNANPTRERCYWRIDSLQDPPRPVAVSADQLLSWRLQGTNLDEVTMRVLRVSSESISGNS